MAESPTTPHSASRIPQSDLALLLTNVFQAWKEAGIVFLVLRNFEYLPEATSNDIDVLVEPKRLAEAEKVALGAAQRSGYLLHNRIEFASLALYFFHASSLRQVQIDLFHDLPWRGFATLAPNQVLAERIDGGLFAIPHPVHGAILSLLGRLLQLGWVGDKYKPAIAAAFRAAPQKAKEELAGLFGQELAVAVLEHATGEHWNEVERLARALRRRLIWRCLTVHPGQTINSLFKDAVRVIRRLLHPGGMSLVILGADGSGKSTVAQRVIENLHLTFPPGKGLRMHWKPVVFLRKRRRPSGQPVVDPHGLPPRNPFASLLYLSWHWLEFFLGAQCQFRPAIFRGGLVVIDRYYYDFLVDQRRYRLQVPLWLVHAMFALLNQPDQVFLLDAPPEVLQARKQEVPAAETARQVAAYREVLSRLPQGQILDATQSAEQVAEEMTRRVLQFLRKRAERS